MAGIYILTLALWNTKLDASTALKFTIDAEVVVFLISSYPFKCEPIIFSFSLQSTNSVSPSRKTKTHPFFLFRLYGTQHLFGYDSLACVYSTQKLLDGLQLLGHTCSFLTPYDQFDIT